MGGGRGIVGGGRGIVGGGRGIVGGGRGIVGGVVGWCSVEWQVLRVHYSDNIHIN